MIRSTSKKSFGKGTTMEPSRRDSKKSWPIGLVEAEKETSDKGKQVAMVEVKGRDNEDLTSKEVKKICEDLTNDVGLKKGTYAEIKQGGR